jgi:hypothetical protein
MAAISCDPSATGSCPRISRSPAAQGVDQVEAPAEGVPGGRPHRLAVDGDVLQPGGLVHRRHPLGDARPELTWIEPGEQSVECVMARDAVGERKETTQPVLFGLAEPLDFLPRVGPGDHRTKGDNQDVGEPVRLGPIDEEVGHIGEVPGD